MPRCQRLLSVVSPAWLVVAVIAGIDGAVLATSGFSLRWLPEFDVLICAAFLAVLYWIYSCVRPVESLAALARRALIYVLYTDVVAILSYLLTGLIARPYIDDVLVHFDRALGFDWLVYHHWFTASGPRHIFTELVYESLGAQVFALLLLLDPLGRSDRANELLTGFMFSSLLTVVVGAFVPAVGAFVHFSTPEAHTTAFVHQYLALKNGSMREIDLAQVQGLVYFPSFHAALAMLCTYVVRGMRWIFRLFLVLNLCIVLVTPVGGGHYLADVLAGLGVAVLTIAFLRTKHFFTRSSVACTHS